MAATRSNSLGNLYVPRVVSFIVLLAIILLVGIVFFQVMAQFIVPLFLACVLLVVFQPLHRWYLEKFPKWPRIAALLTTFTIMLTVLVPTIYLGWNAYAETVSRIQAAGNQVETPATSAPATPATPDAAKDENTLYAKVVAKGHEWAEILKDKTGVTIERDDLQNMAESAIAWVSAILPQIAGAAIRILVGLIIMIIALYYFFADGPSMINGLISLSPLDKRHELELLARFAEISRSVVVATMLSAVVQGILAGVGFYFALPSGAPIFLLDRAHDGLGDRAVRRGGRRLDPDLHHHFPVRRECVHRGRRRHDGGNWKVATALAIYCAVVVSGIDNVIKPLVLHGQANLHPLLALLSILGGIQVLGPVGISGRADARLVSAGPAWPCSARNSNAGKIRRSARSRYHPAPRPWPSRSKPPSKRPKGRNTSRSSRERKLPKAARARKRAARLAAALATCLVDSRDSGLE